MNRKCASCGAPEWDACVRTLIWVQWSEEILCGVCIYLFRIRGEGIVLLGPRAPTEFFCDADGR